MSPHIHPINTMIPATRSTSAHRHNSPSPTANGTPPPTVTPSATTALLTNSSSTQDSQRLLKIRRFLGALVQFGQDTSSDQHVGDRLRSLVLSLAVSVASQCFVFVSNKILYLTEWWFVHRGVSNRRSGSHKLPAATKRPPVSKITFTASAARSQLLGSCEQAINVAVRQE